MMLVFSWVHQGWETGVSSPSMVDYVVASLAACGLQNVSRCTKMDEITREHDGFQHQAPTNAGI